MSGRRRWGGVGVVAAEVRGRPIGRIYRRRVADSSADRLLPFVQEAVAPGAVVITTGLQSYGGLSGLGYPHDRGVVLGSVEPAEAATQGSPRLPRSEALAAGHTPGRSWLTPYVHFMERILTAMLDRLHQTNASARR